jgi:predicted AAA+ superfamily ATPase
MRRIEAAWRHRSIVWLSGVRRVGKTTLCQTLPDTEYFDCELPSVRRTLEDPESFLRGRGPQRIVLDEIHRLRDPSELLKIAADHFTRVRMIATGSSSLQASRKFRDTLTGRKVELQLTPLMSADLEDFGRTDTAYRLLRGGLPPFFLSPALPERDFQEWVDSYWAKDIQELFRLERCASFQKFFELLLAQSGGLFEATAFAGPCEVSRPTIYNYLKVMEASRVCHVLKPYSTHRATEIVSAPKVYGFDTGFVAYHRAWHELRAEDKGALWEHYVLNELQSRTQGSVEIRYWRDKRGHEIDFVLLRRGRSPTALECKWKANAFDAANVRAFRRAHAGGENWVVAQDVDRCFRRTVSNLSLEFISLTELASRLEG